MSVGRSPAGARMRRCRMRVLEFSSRFYWLHPVIALTVNGQARRFEQPLKVEALVQALELAGKRIAVERNGEIVPRSRFADEWLADGDRIEIVVAVGGG
jgi:sulfur carrier protein